MQDRAPLTPTPLPSSAVLNAGTPDTEGMPAEDAPSASLSQSAAQPAANKLDQSLNALRETLEEHKGKLAISAAATLGLIVYYKWREKALAQEAPQEYEHLQRIKNRVRHADDRQDSQDKAGQPHPTSEQT